MFTAAKDPSTKWILGGSEMKNIVTYKRKVSELKEMIEVAFKYNSFHAIKVLRREKISLQKLIEKKEVESKWNSNHKTGN